MSEDQFHNEVLVYNVLLPLLGAERMAPRMYSGSSEFVLLEKVEGMEPTRQKPFMDVEHLVLTLRRLGEFHAMSYNAKAEGKLPGRAKELRDVGFSRRPPETYRKWMTAALLRAVRPNIGLSPLVDEAVKALEDSLPEIVRFLETGEEDMRVVCHGDFCSNNVLYRYESGRPVDMKLLDFQTSRYTTPAVDLSFFLYLNTCQPTRDSHWDYLLDAYLDSLESFLTDKTSYPGRSALLQEFSAKAFYGLLHCSFFLPMMLFPDVPHFLDQEFDPNSDDYIELSTSLGGEEGTRAVADIFKHLLDRGYIKALLENYKK